MLRCTQLALTADAPLHTVCVAVCPMTLSLPYDLPDCSCSRHALRDFSEAVALSREWISQSKQHMDNPPEHSCVGGCGARARLCCTCVGACLRDYNEAEEIHLGSVQANLSVLHINLGDIDMYHRVRLSCLCNLPSCVSSSALLPQLLPVALC